MAGRRRLMRRRTLMMQGLVFRGDWCGVQMRDGLVRQTMTGLPLLLTGTHLLMGSSLL
jgi:hypothetical protein